MEHVDVTGEVCPRPVLIVRRRLESISADDTLLVRGDHPPAKRNLERTCANHGYDIEDRTTGGDGDRFELLIRSADGDESPSAREDDD